MWLSHRHMTEPERCVAAERDKTRWRGGKSRGQIHCRKKVTDEVVESRWRWRGKRKRPDLQEEGAPSWPYTEAESCSCLYLAQGPQIVKSAPGPCVQTGKNCCHPSQRPGPGTIPAHAIAREEWWDHVVWVHVYLTHVQSWSHSVATNAFKAEVRGYKPWEHLHVDTLMSRVSSLHLALPNGAFMFTAIPHSLHFSFPWASEKGTVSPITIYPRLLK